MRMYLWKKSHITGKGALFKWFTTTLDVAQPLLTLGLVYFPSLIQASFLLSLTCCLSCIHNAKMLWLFQFSA